MDPLSLLKVPLLLVSAYCAHVSAKSPNPPATPEEQARYVRDNHVRDPINVSLLWRTRLFRHIFYFFALAEAVLITLSAAAAFPRIPQLFHPSKSLEARSLYLSNIYIFGACSMSLAAYIRATCYRHLGRFFTFELSIKKGHHLVTDGPYAVVRHPSYVGSVLFYFGACLTQLGPGSLLAASGMWSAPAGVACAVGFVAYGVYVCSFLLARVPKEDLVMRQQFGAEWETWARHTPYRLVPYVY